MEHDFTTLPARRGTGSSKWDSMLEDNPGVASDVVPLSIADMEFLTPEPIKAALHRLIDSTSLGYTDPTEDFFDACIAWQERRHGWTPERSWIVTSPGVVPALYTAVTAFTKPGDGVIVQPPVYYPFFRAVEQTGRTLVENPLLRDGTTWTFDLEGLSEIIRTEHPKAIIISSPHNPVGRVWSEEELRGLLAVCDEGGLTILCDEIHDDLIMPGHTHTTLLKLATPEQASRIVVCTACSKTFSLAGVQCSAIFIPSDDLRKRFLGAYSAQGHFQLNAFAYPALIAAYNECEGWLDELIDVIWGNYLRLRERLDGRLGGLRVHPLEGTYLSWVDFSAWGMPADVREAFLHEHAQLYLDSGAVFGEGGEAFERFNIACPAWVLDAALDRLEAAYGSEAFELARQGSDAS